MPKSNKTSIKQTLIKGLDGRLVLINVANGKEMDSESIEKGNSESLMGGVEFSAPSLITEKTGEEIKEKLGNLKNIEEIKKQTHLTKLIELTGLINQKYGVSPDESICEWKLKGLSISADSLPKQFSWGVISKLNTSKPENIGLRDSFLTPKTEEIKEEQENILHTYNHILDKYIDNLVEICYLTSFINNLENERVYPLTLKQAAIYGF